jgi:hypothetical protein
MRTWILSLIGLCLVGVMYAQGLLICTSCGREAKPGETACSRCSAELPKPKKEITGTGELPAMDVAGEISKLTVACIKEDFRLASRAETNGNPAIAYCYYKNAMALSRLLENERFSKESYGMLLRGTERMMRQLKTAEIKCRVCQGRGKLAKSQSTIKVDGVTKTKLESGNRLAEPVCPMCNGACFFIGTADVERTKAELLRGRTDYEQRRMLAGETRLGRLFVTPELEKLLNARQRALVMTGYTVPCAACQGLETMSCATCRGERWIKCPGPGCKSGRIDMPKSQTNARKEIRLNDVEIDKSVCPRCNGVGTIRCSKCDALGSVPCKSCSGSGQAVRCIRCLGVGVMDCTRCKGQGKMKDGAACLDCKSEGSVLCTGCRGEGAQTR